MILVASPVPFTGPLSCTLVHSGKPQPGSPFDTSICVSQATLITDSRLYLESEYRNPCARHRLGDSQPRTSRIPLSYVRHKLLWQGYWLGLCRILYFRFGLCDRRGVLRFFSLSLLLATHRYRYLHGSTEPALWVSLTDDIPRSSVGQASDVGFAAARVLLAPQRWTFFQHSR